MSPLPALENKGLTAQGAHEGAKSDADLAELIDRWPRLPAAIRGRIMELAAGFAEAD